MFISDEKLQISLCFYNQNIYTMDILLQLSF